MSVPYELRPAKAGIVASGGETTVVTLKFSGRSYLSKLIVVQTEGALDEFDVDVYNNADAGPDVPASVSASDAEGNPIPLDCYRVTPTLVGVNGRMHYFSGYNSTPADQAAGLYGGGGGDGFLLFCTDAFAADRQGQVPNNLYIRITPAGTGEKVFAIAVGGDIRIGGSG